MTSPQSHSIERLMPLFTTSSFRQLLIKEETVLPTIPTSQIKEHAVFWARLFGSSLGGY